MQIDPLQQYSNPFLQQLWCTSSPSVVQDSYQEENSSRQISRFSTIYLDSIYLNEIYSVSSELSELSDMGYDLDDRAIETI